jgi:hypothetical protein
MRLLVVLFLAFTALCEVDSPFKLVSPTPEMKGRSLGTTDTIALLLRKEYVKVLAILNTIYCLCLFLIFPQLTQLTIHHSTGE